MGSSVAGRHRVWALAGAAALWIGCSGAATAREVLKTFPPAGHWEVRLITQPNGKRACSMTSAVVKGSDGRDMIMGLMLTETTDVLRLTEEGAPRPGLNRLQLSSPKLGSVSAVVANQPAHANAAVTNYSGRLGDFGDPETVLTALDRGGDLKIAGGGVSWTVPLEGFKAAHDQLADCVQQRQTFVAPGLDWSGGKSRTPAPLQDDVTLDTQPDTADPGQAPRPAQSTAPSGSDLVMLSKAKGVPAPDPDWAEVAVTNLRQRWTSRGTGEILIQLRACGDVLNSIRTWYVADHCIAEHLAAQRLAPSLTAKGVSVDPYFGASATEARIREYLAVPQGEPAPKAAHLQALRAAVASAMTRSSSPPPPKPSPAELGKIETVLIDYLNALKTSDDAAKAYVRACYAGLPARPSWSQAQTCFISDDAQSHIADAAARLQDAVAEGEFAPDNVRARQLDVCARTSGAGSDAGARLQALRKLVEAMFTELLAKEAG